MTPTPKLTPAQRRQTSAYDLSETARRLPGAAAKRLMDAKKRPYETNVGWRLAEKGKSL